PATPTAATTSVVPSSPSPPPPPPPLPPSLPSASSSSAAIAAAKPPKHAKSRTRVKKLIDFTASSKAATNNDTAGDEAERERARDRLLQSEREEAARIE